MYLIHKQKITLRDSKSFASASGDYNPIHIDAVYARKTQFGFCICHGVNILLTVLDCLNRNGIINGIPNFDCKFQRPVYLDTDFDIYWDKNSTTACVMSNDEISVSINFDNLSQNSVFKSNVEIIESPLELTPQYVSREARLNELKQIMKQIDLQFRGKFAIAECMYPNLAKTACSSDIATMLLTSDIVGMKIPGRDSLFVGLRKVFDQNGSAVPALALNAYDPRFGLLNATFEGLYSTYKIEAMFRSSPSSSPNLYEIREQVELDEFVNHRVLIIGGSRGLGRYAAAVLAMGGADVTCTFSQGQVDAECLQNELKNLDISCRFFRFDVLNDPIPDLSDFDRIFYFASPRIIPENSRNVSRLSNLYELFFVTKFHEICNTLMFSNKHHKIFYPSTLFIDQPQNTFKAYVNAKTEGELIAHKFNKDSCVRVSAPRLPRIKTDQTLGTNQILLSELNFLLPHVREFMHE